MDVEDPDSLGLGLTLTARCCNRRSWLRDMKQFVLTVLGSLWSQSGLVTNSILLAFYSQGLVKINKKGPFKKIICPPGKPIFFCEKQTEKMI